MERRRSQTYQNAHAGFTIVEMSIATAIVLLFAGGAVMAFASLQDSAMVSVTRATQGHLESTITQAAIRRDMSPQGVLQANPALIAAVTRSGMGATPAGVLPEGATFTCTASGCTYTRPRSNMTVRYTVTPNGDVRIAGVSPMPKNYRILNGELIPLQ
jgi:prepilin-type N-terminal cleavage/methylation domain-containing protein